MSRDDKPENKGQNKKDDRERLEAVIAHLSFDQQRRIREGVQKHRKDR